MLTNSEFIINKYIFFSIIKWRIIEYHFSLQIILSSMSIELLKIDKTSWGTCSIRLARHFLPFKIEMKLSVLHLLREART